MTLVGGIAIALWQARLAGVERAQTVQRLNHARAVLSDYHDRVASSRGSSEARRRLLQDALSYLETISQGASGDHELMREVAHAYERIAAVQGSSDGTSSGSPSNATASQQKAVAIREKLVRQTSSEADRLALARAYNGIGDSYRYSGSPEKAVEYLQNAISILESMLGPATREEVRALLATSYLTIAKAYGSAHEPNLGDTRTALAYMRGALKMQAALAADFPTQIKYQQGLAVTYSALSQLYSAMSEPEEELEQIRNAVAAARKIDAPEDAVVQGTLAMLYTQLGHCHAKRAVAPNKSNVAEQWQHARDAYGTALSIY